MASGTAGLAFLAGILSILSPCVLPLLPLILGTAVSQHRWGVVALAGGLALSFTAVGLFVATIGYSLGFDEKVFRTGAAVLMIAIGLVLAAPPLQARFAMAAGPAATWTENRFGGFSTNGFQGQFALGLLLGAVWSPCVGPTLGAASLLAAKGESLAMVTLVMLAFGIGAAIPLLVLGLLSREASMGWRNRLMQAGKGMKTVLGAGLVVFGIVILAGFDKKLEAVLVEISPDWLTRLTTQF